MSKTAQLFARWQALFAGVPPLRHHLRQAFSERWLRIHNLPGAKRYPETDDERRQVLERYAVVGGRVLGDGSPVYAFLAATEGYASDNDLLPLGLETVPHWSAEYAINEDIADEVEPYALNVAQLECAAEETLRLARASCCRRPGPTAFSESNHRGGVRTV